MTRHKIMYYAYTIREVKIVKNLARHFLIAALLLLVFPAKSFAISEKIAEDYRAEGLKAQRSGDYDTALSSYQKAVQVDPQYAAAFNDLGVVYELKGLLDFAEESYLESIKWDANYLPAYYNLAALYEKKGQPLLAFYYWKKRAEKGIAGEYWTEQARKNIHRLAEQSVDIRTAMGKMEATGLSEEIIEQKRKEFEEKIALAQEHFRAGEKLCQEKEYMKAIEEFNAALKLTPGAAGILKARQKAMKELIADKIDGHYDAARRFYDLGDYSDARAEVQKALTLIPETSD